MIFKVSIDAGHSNATGGKRTPNMTENLYINGKLVREKGKPIHEFEFNSLVAKAIGNALQRHGIQVKYVNDMAKDKKCGCSNAENPMSIVVDYGGANVAKPLHVGHLRSAIIGESIKRTAKFLGQVILKLTYMIILQARRLSYS